MELTITLSLKLYEKNDNIKYADSAEAAATLAIVTGAQIKGKDPEVYGYGGAGGYNHFHDINHNIHIWYGSKKPW